jgi:hypothetical protein
VRIREPITDMRGMMAEEDSVLIPIGQAVGFDAIREQRVSGGEGNCIIEMPKRPCDRETLDIPAFLRHSRTSTKGAMSGYFSQRSRCSAQRPRTQIHLSDLSV